jgi:hypothetical protein
MATTRSGKERASWLELLNVRPSSMYVVRSVLAIILGVCPLAIGAWLAENSGHWELFERSGSITTAIGLVLASRRYVRHDVFELITLDTNNEQKYKFGEILEDAITAKLGLALSAFGTLIWGWGRYLGWWSFSYLVVWAIFDFRRARRDFVRIRNNEVDPIIVAEATSAAPTVAQPRSAPAGGVRRCPGLKMPSSEGPKRLDRGSCEKP